MLQLSKPLRKCNVCGLEAWDETDLKMFKTSKKSKYGRRKLCKKCSYEKYPYEKRKEYFKNRYKNNRERIIKEHREYRIKNAEKIKIYGKKYYENNIMEKREKQRIYRKEHKEERRAQLIALRKVPITSACSNCGGNKNLERHHPDYSKPLEIIILCKRCHKRLHEFQKQV